MELSRIGVGSRNRCRIPVQDMKEGVGVSLLCYKVSVNFYSFWHKDGRRSLNTEFEVLLFNLLSFPRK